MTNRPNTSTNSIRFLKITWICSALVYWHLQLRALQPICICDQGLQRELRENHLTPMYFKKLKHSWKKWKRKNVEKRENLLNHLSNACLCLVAHILTSPSSSEVLCLNIPSQMEVAHKSYKWVDGLDLILLRKLVSFNSGCVILLPNYTYLFE